ncbi:hypothetical protein NC651_009903 [Populus alba x Populus x berolinensis]|nr:hypothetical protein NC651_009903 [Populus alba x Populus x berolinensis]
MTIHGQIRRGSIKWSTDIRKESKEAWQKVQARSSEEASNWKVIGVGKQILIITCRSINHAFSSRKLKKLAVVIKFESYFCEEIFIQRVN